MVFTVPLRLRPAAVALVCAALVQASPPDALRLSAQVPRVAPGDPAAAGGLPGAAARDADGAAGLAALAQDLYAAALHLLPTGSAPAVLDLYGVAGSAVAFADMGGDGSAPSHYRPTQAPIGTGPWAGAAGAEPGPRARALQLAAAINTPGFGGGVARDPDAADADGGAAPAPLDDALVGGLTPSPLDTDPLAGPAPGPKPAPSPGPSAGPSAGQPPGAGAPAAPNAPGPGDGQAGVTPVAPPAPPVMTVAEPASLALTSLAIGALLYMRRRRGASGQR